MIGNAKQGLSENARFEREFQEDPAAFGRRS
jgi:hypothetical protein